MKVALIVRADGKSRVDDADVLIRELGAKAEHISVHHGVELWFDGESALKPDARPNIPLPVATSEKAKPGEIVAILGPIVVVGWTEDQAVRGLTLGELLTSLASIDRLRAVIGGEPLMDENDPRTVMQLHAAEREMASDEDAPMLPPRGQYLN